MTELITSNHEEKMHDLFEGTRKRLKIVTPYLKKGMVENMISSVDLDKSNVELTVITRFKREDFISAASDVEAIQYLLSVGARVFAIKKLHTKLYIFDDEKVVLGSANLTFGGQRNNVELSMLIENDSDVLNDIGDYWRYLIEGLSDFEITEEKAEQEKGHVDKAKEDRKNSKVQFGENTIDFGADKQTDEEYVDSVQQAFENQNTSNESESSAVPKELLNIWNDAIEDLPAWQENYKEVADGRFVARRSFGIATGGAHSIAFKMTPKEGRKWAEQPARMHVVHFVKYLKTKDWKESKEDKENENYRVMKQWFFDTELAPRLREAGIKWE